MRLAPIVTSIGLLALFSACNAILGNESDYELVGTAGAGAKPHTGGSAGNASGGKGGAGGRSANGGGMSSSEAGTAEAGGEAGSEMAGRGGTGGVGGNAGADDSAGTSGEAGAPGCVSRGAENCFNGVDDDCNGHIDCDDAACSEPAECVPAPSGATLGHFAAPGDSCESGFTRLDLHQDLQVPTECKGCSCVSPTNLLCDSGVYGHGAKPCPSYQFDGQLWDVFNDRCSPLPMDNNLHYYSIRGTSQCTAAGTPTLDPPTWSEDAIFCLANRVGVGCGPGKACVPVTTPSLCTLSSGHCVGDYANDRGIWYEGLDDQRACSDCSCGLGTADCSASYIGVYSDGSCGTTATALPSVADQGDSCGLPFGPASARIIGAPVSGSGSCQPNNFMSGDAMPTNGHQACCAQ